MKIAIIAVNGHLKMAVNPMTRQVMDQPQQFELLIQHNHNGFGLRILSLKEYVEDPIRINVTEEHYH